MISFELFNHEGEEAALALNVVFHWEFQGPFQSIPHPEALCVHEHARANDDSGPLTKN